MMKKIYFVGDMITNTGPAIVNKSYYPFLKDHMFFCLSNNKIIRIFHLFSKILFLNIVIISGYSGLNRLFLKILRKFRKRTYYLMHGFFAEEVKYKDINNKKVTIDREYEFLNLVDIIICVSEKFSVFLKEIYPEFKDKIKFINNGINTSSTINNKINHNCYTLISVGGGLKLKNNLTVCRAIAVLEDNIKFIVIGSQAENGCAIKEYPFVEYYDYLTHDEVLEKMCESDLYIQNSYFETFGLSIIEALQCGCNILVGKNIGALSILKNVQENDIINNNDDINEISKKIKNKMTSKCCKITFDVKKSSCKFQCEKLLNMVMEEK